VGGPHAPGGKPTCTWWVSPQVVFFRKIFLKNTTKKNLILFFDLYLSTIPIPVSSYEPVLLILLLPDINH
jgi:hypothetical protein